MDSKSKRAHSADSGYEPQDKKQKMQAAQADKADKYLLTKTSGTFAPGLYEMAY